MGTFETPELAAHTFDVAAWRFGRPRDELNFPEIRDLKKAVFVAPKVPIVTHEQEQENRCAYT